MAFKLLLLAEHSWRRLDGHTLLPLVRTGKRCVDGVFPERDDLETVASDSTTTRETKDPSVRKIKSTKSGESSKHAA